MAEFVEGYERLAEIHPSVSIFGSALFDPDHPSSQLTEEIALKLSNAGFSVVSGGGPGSMEATNKVAFSLLWSAPAFSLGYLTGFATHWSRQEPFRHQILI